MKRSKPPRKAKPSESPFRYDKYMPKTNDISLIVLKGHLLIEEALVDVASWTFPYSQSLNDADLSFHKLACVVRAAVPQRTKEADDEAWRLIFWLNSLRNDLAHNLESSKRQPRLDQILKHVDSTMGKLRFHSRLKGKRGSARDAERLRLAVEASLGFLYSISFAYEREEFQRARWLG